MLSNRIARGDPLLFCCLHLERKFRNGLAVVFERSNLQLALDADMVRGVNTV